MNTLKPLLICAVLAAIGYAVYVRINGGEGPPPPGAPQDWGAPPEVQLGSVSEPGGIPPVGAESASAGGTAPPFGAPAAPASAAPEAGDAPPFDPGVGPPAGSAASTSAPPFDASSTSIPQAGAPTDGVPPVGVGAIPADSSATPDNAAADRYQLPPAADNDPLAVPAASVPERYQTPADSTPDGYAAGPPAGPDRYSVPGDNASGDLGAAAQQNLPTGTFAEVLESAKRDLESGQLAGGLAKLSAWYDDPRLSPAEQQQLNQLLDQVGGTVVYSTQHLLEPPYEVQPGERLEDIAQRYSVPWELLAKINGITDPAGLRPGERLKVVRGPFNAVVNLEKRELTLMLSDGLYAGRFPIGIGQEQPPREGTYSVSDKVVDPVYHGSAKVAGAGDATNPYGTRWIGLGSDLGIHGTDRSENIGRTDLPGSISLSPRDIEDVFDILATGSKVTIRR